MIINSNKPLVQNSAAIDLEWIPFDGQSSHDKTLILVLYFVHNRRKFSMVVIATVAILTIGSTTAYADTGFNNGYAKGKFDITQGQPLNDTCLPKGLACDQFQFGYVTAINQNAYQLN